jgi:hypothetical protein
MEKIKLTGGTIWALENIYGTTAMTSKLNQLRTLENGTVGKEIANLLDNLGFRLIPKFENHDLKHVVLGYEMTMKDEIKMQAYLVGNGNFTFPCLIFLSLGLFYPSIWLDLPREYKIGKSSKSIFYLTLDNCMEKDLNEIKSLYGRNNNATNIVYTKVGTSRAHFHE